jgi:hypothetical protein
MVDWNDNRKCAYSIVETTQEKAEKRNSRAKKGKVREEDANEEIKAWVARSQRSLKL